MIKATAVDQSTSISVPPVATTAYHGDDRAVSGASYQRRRPRRSCRSRADSVVHEIERMTSAARANRARERYGASANPTVTTANMPESRQTRCTLARPDGIGRPGSVDGLMGACLLYT